MQARLSTNFADQYEAWRIRIADKCWGKTGKDILNVTDAVCAAALHKLRTEESKGTKEALAIVNANEWVTQCWVTITKSLHDDILMKVAHVERGQIESLLKNIAAALVVDTMDEVGHSAWNSTAPPCKKIATPTCKLSFRTSRFANES